MHKLLVGSLSALVLALGAVSASAATLDTAEYSVTYDVFPSFGTLQSWGESGSAELKNLSFQWAIQPNAGVGVVSTGDTVAQAFDLPSFTLTAKSGWSLSGLQGMLGNFAFTTFGASAQSSAIVSGNLAIDGVSYGAFGGALGQTVEFSGPNFASGFYSASGELPLSFTTVTFSDLTLNLSATGGTGGFASITGQPQNLLQVSFVAAAVPEPQTWGMLLAGMGLMGGVALRRRRHLQQDL